MRTSYLFSRNDKLGSKAICWASSLVVKDLDKVPSHVAILLEFENVKEAIVIESTLSTGVRLIPYSVWLEHNELCYKIECEQKSDLDRIFDLMNKIWNKKYDWGGIAYFAVCFLKFYLFKIDIPSVNKWQNEDKYFCSEAASTLTDYRKADMCTPAKMCSDFLKEMR